MAKSIPSKKSKPCKATPVGDCCHPRNESLVRAVDECLHCGGFIASLRSLYERVDAEATRTGMYCLGGGACCKFDIAPYRLYLSSGELALLTSSTAPDLSRCARKRCPFQHGPSCLARESRPLACRVFFCRRKDKAGNEDMYESFHGEIRRLHETYCLPYAYVELISAVVQLFMAS